MELLINAFKEFTTEELSRYQLNCKSLRLKTNKELPKWIDLLNYSR